MRFHEITDKNTVWAQINQIDFNSIFKSFDIINDFWPRLLATKSPKLISIHRNNIVEYLNLVNSILEKINTFPDVEDTDLIQIKEKLVYIRKSLEEITKI